MKMRMEQVTRQEMRKKKQKNRTANRRSRMKGPTGSKQRRWFSALILLFDIFLIMSTIIRKRPP